MKTKILFVILILSGGILSTSCKKQSLNDLTEQNVKAGKLPCSPYRTVTGLTQLVNELNIFSICATSSCQNTISTTTISNNTLFDTNGSVFSFSETIPIAISKQNEIITAAISWANANTPSGFSLSKITYFKNYALCGCGDGFIGIHVLYKKCGSPTPLPN